MALSPARSGRFTASSIYRLMAASGQVDWDPVREGARGAGYTCWVDGEKYTDEVFNTVAEYDAFVRAERAKMGALTLSAGAKTYAEEKAAELLFTADELEPQLSTVDIRRGKEREESACLALSLHLDSELFFTGDDQRFITLGDSAGATPDGRIGSAHGVTFDVKSPDRLHHLSNILSIKNGENLKSVSPIYYWQQQCQIAAAEADYGYWCSYNPCAINPRARLHVVRIDRNQSDIDLMLHRIDLAAEYRNEIIRRIKEL